MAHFQSKTVHFSGVDFNEALELNDFEMIHRSNCKSNGFKVISNGASVFISNIVRYLSVSRRILYRTNTLSQSECTTFA